MSAISLVPDALISAIRGARRIAVMGHETPDADAVGSAGALTLALQSLGIDARLILPGGLSRKVAFLIEFAGLQPYTDASGLEGCDLAIVCDTAKEKRVNCPGGYAALAGIPLINVDHHAGNTGFGAHRWIDGSRSSTSEMAFELIRALGATLTVPTATLLYAGVHSDTKGFSLSNTTPRSLLVGHELAAAGARISELCEQLDRSLPRAEFMLNQLVYANTRISDDGRMAWSAASYEEIQRTGCSADTIDDQVEIPRSVAGIRLAILFTEGEPNVVRMNFRGEGGLSVLRLAEQFGGGGHHAAAGARRRAPFQTVIEEVLAAAAVYEG
jgi:phosphoesterase RecJ-like protein